MGKRWSNEEIRYLEDNWYHVTTKYIANKLKRTESSVSTKAYKIGLSTKILYYSVYEVSLMLGVSKAKITRNINNGKLRAYKDRTLHKRFSIKEWKSTIIIIKTWRILQLRARLNSHMCRNNVAIMHICIILKFAISR